MTDAEQSDQRRIRLPVVRTSANRIDIGLREFAIGAIHSRVDAATRSALAVSIAIVVATGSQPQMRRVDARFVVAGMTDALSERYGAMRQHPRVTVRSMDTSIDANRPVPIRPIGKSSEPWPA